MNALIKRILVCLAALCSMSALLKADDFDKLFDKYASKEGVESVHITQTMLKMLSGSNKNAKNFSGVKRILVLEVEKNIQPRFSDDLQDYLDTHVGVELISSVKSDGELVDTYFYDGSKYDYPNNLFLMRNEDEEEIVAIFIYGDFNLKNVAELPNMIQ